MTNETKPSDDQNIAGVLQVSSEFAEKPVTHDKDETRSKKTESTVSEDAATPAEGILKTTEQEKPVTGISEENITRADDNQLIIVEDSVCKRQKDIKESAPQEDATPEESMEPQEDATLAEATDSSHSTNDEEEQSESTSISEATVENVSIGSEHESQNREIKINDEPSGSGLKIVEPLADPENHKEADIKIAAELGFHLNEPTEKSSVAKTTAPRSLSPADSLEEFEQESEEKAASVEKPEPKEAWIVSWALGSRPKRHVLLGPLPLLDTGTNYEFSSIELLCLCFPRYRKFKCRVSSAIRSRVYLKIASDLASSPKLHPLVYWVLINEAG